MTKNSPLTSSQIEKIKVEFVKIDKDGDGQVSTKELESVLRSMRHKLKASEGDIKKALKEIDRDGDGIVDVHEYILIPHQIKISNRYTHITYDRYGMYGYEYVFVTWHCICF